MIRILQLTDLHVFCEPELRLKGIPTRECLQDVVAWILQNEAPFDHLIVTGDHTHDEQPQSYQAVQQILTPWADRIWQVPGNHDDREILRSVFAERIKGQGADQVRFSFIDEGWLCVGLDTHLPGEVAGWIEQEQLDWLRSVISEASVSQVALFLHHPPVDVNSEWMDAIGLGGRDGLQQLISEDGRIRLVCCGHVHHEFEAQIGAAKVYTTPATGIQFNPAGAVANFAGDAPGYRVIEVGPDGFSTHVVRLPEVRYTPVAD
ncbi:MAG: metallophosphoesterase [Fuerstiella sp.]